MRKGNLGFARKILAIILEAEKK